jgi:hypothetical protein
VCGTVLAVEDDDDLGPEAELGINPLAQQREEHELGGEIQLAGLIAAQDLRWGAKAGAK